MGFDINILRSVFTVMGLCVFVGIAVWAYGRKRHDEFEEAARLPFSDD